MKLDIKKTNLLMMKCCWSIADLTRRSELSNTTLYKIMRGDNNASPKTIGKIAKALGVEPVEILQEKN